MPSASERQHYALQVIFSFFLGLMVLAFIGVGVNTFYPSPAEQYQQRQQDLSQRMERLNVKQPTGSLTATEQAQLIRLQDAQNALQKRQDAAMKDWARVTSIIVVLFATVVMGVSLLLSEQLRVLSNGLLLGGIFTMVYGCGWVIFSGNSLARFVVITFALLVTIGLGYLKFVRTRRERRPGRRVAETTPTQGMPGGASSADIADLSARVDALEARMAVAASVLGGTTRSDKEPPQAEVR